MSEETTDSAVQGEETKKTAKIEFEGKEYHVSEARVKQYIADSDCVEALLTAHVATQIITGEKLLSDFF